MSGYFILGTALMKFHVKMKKTGRGVANGYKGIYIPPNFQNWTYVEYVDNLVNVNI